MHGLDQWFGSLLVGKVIVVYAVRTIHCATITSAEGRPVSECYCAATNARVVRGLIRIVGIELVDKINSRKTYDDFLGFVATSSSDEQGDRVTQRERLQGKVA